MIDDQSQDICRVCRCEAQSDRPLFYPCICTGSIKYIHQDCLMQWMRYSHKEYCELCGHRFSFQPIYSPDMPRVLPLRDVIGGLLAAIAKAAKSWFHYSLVGIAWFGIVPLSAYRTYRYLFRASSFDMFLSLPFDVFSTDNVAGDAFRGCFVVCCTLLSFIGLVWLREQILHGGGPDWLDRDDGPAVAGGVNGAVADEGENAEALAAGAEEAGIDDDDDDGPAPEDPEHMVPYGPENQQQQQGDVPEEAQLHDNNNNNNIANEVPIDVPMNNAAPPLGGGAPAIDELGMGDDNELRHRRGVAVDDAAADAAANNNNNNNNPLAALADDGAENENDNDEPNWNPMEWERGAEELTWERLLGLDGSLVFLEHVFWIIAVNTLFIFAFAFCPYCIGHFIMSSMDMLEADKPLLHFHGLITTLCGYCFLGVTLVVLHSFARIFRMRRVRWMIGMCYIFVKVSLLSVVEIGVLPLVCGWWLDICSLPLFDGTIRDRKVSFKAAPGTSLFVHWMFGMVYVYYFAAFISMLREVLRPGVLWFLRNLNDPDFSPIQEMIHLPILRHVRRLVASAMIFGFAVLLMLWLPIRVLKTMWPSFLPYTLSGDSEVNELNLQLLLLQIILPGFFEQSHTRIWLKGLLRIWCVCVSWLLGIRSYLLGNDQPTATGADGQAAAADNEEGGVAGAADVEGQAQPNNNENEAAPPNLELEEHFENLIAEIGQAAAQPPPPPPPPVQPQQQQQQQQQPVERNLAAAHQAIMQRDVPLGFQPYDKPTLFPLRLCGLMACMCVSLVVASLITLTVPVWIGRQVMTLWSVGGHITNQVTQLNAASTAATAATEVATSPRPHELYTAALGTYLCWIISRGIAIAVNLLPQGRAVVMDKMRHWLRIAASYALPVLIFVLMLGVIPLLFGLLLELVVVIPLRVPFFHMPIHFLWQDWALGVLYTKIAIALTLMGPDWHLKRALERAYRDGLRDIDLQFLIKDLAMPVIVSFGLALAIPYVLAHSIMPLIFTNPLMRVIISRLFYPVFFVSLSVLAYIYFEIKQFKKLYVSIKVDKYLVGQRLVNYEHRKRQQEAAAATNPKYGDDKENDELQVDNALAQEEAMAAAAVVLPGAAGDAENADDNVKAKEIHGAANAIIEHDVELIDLVRDDVL